MATALDQDTVDETGRGDTAPVAPPRVQPRRRPGTPFPAGPPEGGPPEDAAPFDSGPWAATSAATVEPMGDPDEGRDWEDEPRGWLDRVPRGPVATFAALYAVAVAVMLVGLRTHPGFSYNWENYTIRGAIDFLRDPTSDVFLLRDGLMTNSGQSWPSVLPIWLGMTVGGESLTAMRVPIVLISALSVPLTWVLGRRVASPPVALAAAGLVLLSPVFLLYGRTATLVGMSLTPALLGFILLHGALRNPGSWRWLLGLNATLVLSGYAYGPIRFLWLIALGLFLVEIAFRREAWRGLATGFAVTLVVVAASAVVLPRAEPGDTWVESLKLYYNGRGEQVFALSDDPGGYQDFLRQTEEERAANAAADSDDLAVELILQNARDLRDLLLDRDTLPAVTDYWNNRGRLHPGFMVPVFLFGMALSLATVWRSTEQRLLQALLWGFSLPLLLTSKVHIGRLVFIVPVVALITALPLTGVIRWLASRQRPRDRAVFLRQGSPVVAGLLVVVGGGLGWADWTTDIPPTGMAVAIGQIDALALVEPEGPLIYVFGDEGGREIELLNVGEMELALGDRVRFSDSATPDVVHGDEGPLLVYGAMLDKVGQPELVPSYCTAVYLIAPGVEERFLEATEGPADATCGGPLTYEVLP